MQRQRRGVPVLVGAALVMICAIVYPAAGQHSLVFEDFESGDFDARWWWYSDSSSFQCALDSPGYTSEHALRIAYNNAASQWAGCGMDVSDPANWQQTEGLRFMWRSDTPGKDVELTLNIVDPTQTSPDTEGNTPFEAYLTTPYTEWEAMTLSWDAFVKPEWVGPAGISELDLAHLSEFSFVIGERMAGTLWIDDIQLIGGNFTAPIPAEFDKFALWTDGTQLRGINTWQRVVVPAIDGDEFLGPEHVGPPYSLIDFDQIAQLGANLVVLSFPGLFTETPPYVLDEAVQTHLDLTLAMLSETDLFAVIAFRTGPGRSDFTFYDDDIEEWGDPALINDKVWTDQDTQDAWVEMWRYTAERYRGNPIVVGYNLMVEPNAAGRLLDIYEPEEFYPNYANTLYDWNQFYPRLVAGIREVDMDTPILVGAMGWSAVRWLPFLRVLDDPRIVYAVHQYEPQSQYTHQEPDGTNTYPGQFDVDWDGTPDQFNRDWLNAYLSTIRAFQAEHGVPVAVMEYGVVRWVPNASDFMRDSMDAFEQLGLNHAFWAWNPIWPPHNAENDAFDILHGSDPFNRENVGTSALIETVRSNWSQNIIRPSAFGPP